MSDDGDALTQNGTDNEEQEEAIPASTGRPARVRKPSRKAASQARQEAELSEKKGEKKGREVRRAKLKKTPTQLEELLN